jgi:hypothetical protein
MFKGVTLLMGGSLAAVAMLSSVAQAQSQEGLVNVNIDDVTAQIPIAAAANICGTNVLILAQQLLLGGGPCKSGSISLAQGGGSSGHGGSQQGLVNVNITNVTAQVPVSIAANVCGTTVAVLTQGLLQGPVNCSAYGQSATVSK